MKCYRITFTETCRYEMFLVAPDEGAAIERAKNAVDHAELLCAGFERFEAEELLPETT